MAMELINEANEATSTTVGFRFCPSDEELVMYYLRNKVIGRPHRFEVIAEIDIYKRDPWELPAHSLLTNRDKVWYFITAVDKYYASVGFAQKRVTPTGYWKVTGKEKQVKHRDRVVGTRKTLVFHSGRAPSGINTSWVMHEYRSCDPELQNAGIAQDAYVLCKIMDKTEEAGTDDEANGEDDQQGDGPPEVIVNDDDAHKLDVEAEPDSSVPPSEHHQRQEQSSEEDDASNKRLKTVEPPSLSAPYFGSPNFPLEPASQSHSNRQVSTSSDLDRNVPPKYIKYLSTLQNEICNLKKEVEALKVEAAQARSSVGSLQYRVDDWTMESMMLKSRASKND